MLEELGLTRFSLFSHSLRRNQFWPHTRKNYRRSQSHQEEYRYFLPSRHEAIDLADCSDPEVAHDSDLAGPFVFALLLGSTLLLVLLLLYPPRSSFSLKYFVSHLRSEENGRLITFTGSQAWGASLFISLST